MDITDKNIELQYQGYMNTSVLWQQDRLYDLEQFDLAEIPNKIFAYSIPEKTRLGNRVEQFVFYELSQNPAIELLLRNQQIQNGKRTIGELDCILKQDGVPIHLEIVYKFYLYDPEVGNSEIEHWIGPNRNDSLKKKLSKLREKQLPLIYHQCSKPVLESLGIDPDSIQQHVCFKAQLFTPFKSKIDFIQLNKQCYSGFYVDYSGIEQFKDFEFYIPNKVDWLQEVHVHVPWRSFDSFKSEVKNLVEGKKAPLCWIKSKDDILQKFFVVWWQGNEALNQSKLE